MEGRGKNKSHGVIEKLEAFRIALLILLFLRLTAFGDLAAKRARVPAIERFAECGRK